MCATPASLVSFQVSSLPFPPSFDVVSLHTCSLFKPTACSGQYCLQKASREYSHFVIALRIRIHKYVYKLTYVERNICTKIARHRKLPLQACCTCIPVNLLLTLDDMLDLYEKEQKGTVCPSTSEVFRPSSWNYFSTIVDGDRMIRKQTPFYFPGPRQSTKFVRETDLLRHTDLTAETANEIVVPSSYRNDLKYCLQYLDGKHLGIPRGMHHRPVACLICARQRRYLLSPLLLQLYE